MLPILRAAEETGVFRRPPKSEYYLLRAGAQSDVKLGALDQAERDEKMKKLYEKERYHNVPQSVLNKEELEKRRETPGSYIWLQKECRRLGLDSMGKSKIRMRAMIEEKTGEPVADPEEVS